ncbi:MAG: hypothetical protein PHF35_04355 [Candidatus Moranbacteria bacterium]|nr:hypothetical protein [Candidatus Moranbacteria bacterium]
MGKYQENICFEVHQAGLILVVLIYLMPQCERFHSTSMESGNIHPTLKKIFDGLTKAVEEKSRRGEVFRYTVNELLIKEFPDDAKTLRALGEVLETFRDINLGGGIFWNRDFGQNIMVCDINSDSAG